MLDNSIRLNAMDAKQQTAVNLRNDTGFAVRKTTPASLSITPRIRLRPPPIPRIQ